MGAGKSVVAKELAKVLKRKLVSTDELIEKTQKKAIGEIFEQKGESYFRRLEREVVKEIASLEDVVVDSGGGIVLDPDNIRDLKKNGILIYVVSSAAMVYSRLKNKTNRPLLTGGDTKEKIKELLMIREPLYKQAADYGVDGDHKTAGQVAQKIIKLLNL